MLSAYIDGYCMLVCVFVSSDCSDSVLANVIFTGDE